MRSTAVILLAITLFWLPKVQGQEVTVTGTVTDQNGLPMPGVNIRIQGKPTGTSTNGEGHYLLNTRKGDILQFTFVGYQRRYIPVGDEPVINVQMEEETIELDEVVLNVLGLAIKKENDLSSSTNIDPRAMIKSGESGLVQSMAGKTSGIIVTTNNGDPGSGAYIQIRGQNTILGEGAPLIILDGVPISNDTFGVFGVVTQSRLNDLDKNDVESVTVLKGAAAAAVYGTGAGNGVIVIRTKSGKGQPDKLRITVKASVAFDEPNTEFAKQSTYGQGYPLAWYTGDSADLATYVWDPSESLSWGDKIASRPGGADEVLIGNRRFEATSGAVYYPVVSKNSREVFNDSNREQVFQTGISFENSVSISYTGNQNATYVSFSDWEQKGIFKRESDYHRKSFRVNHETDVTPDFKVRVGSTYSSIKSNRIHQGDNFHALYIGYLRTPPDFDNRDYKGTYFDDTGLPYPQAQRTYLSHLGAPGTRFNNPGWTIHELRNPSTVHRFLVNPEFIWQPAEHLKFSARYGLDYYIDNRLGFLPVNSAGGGNGFLREETITAKVEDYNVFMEAGYPLTEAISFKSILGINFISHFAKGVYGSENNFVNPFVGDVYLFGNALAENNNAGREVYERRKSGVYALLSINWLRHIALESSWRYERPSTLKKGIFYPSISAGWQFSELFREGGFLRYGKFRVSYGEVGIEPTEYVSSTTFTAGGTGSGWGDYLDGAQYGNPFYRAEAQGNENLKEERIKEVELGLDFKFLDNRINLSGTYYRRITEGALLALPIPASTGFTSRLENAARISNKGVEVDLGLQLIKQGDLNWNLNLNFARNKNLVEDLSGVQSVRLNGGNPVSTSVVEGQPFGSLWGAEFLRNDDGSLRLDANGYPQLGREPTILGNPNPDWTGAIRTSLSWNGFTLSALLETAQGIDRFADTQRVLKIFGLDPVTALESVAPPGGLTNIDGLFYPEGTVFRGTIRDFGGGPVPLDSYWYTGLGSEFEGVRDGSWTRLREVSLFYELPDSVVDKFGIERISVGFTGRNLFLWTPFEGIDPEVSMTGPSKGRGHEYFSNPNTRSFMVTLNMGF